MKYKEFKVTVRLSGGEKLNFKITAKGVNQAKLHVMDYLNKKGRKITSIQCSVLKINQ